MSMLKAEQPKNYKDGRTKQSFKDSTDINQILKKAQRTGTISHLSKYQPVYGDFSDFDFQTAHNTLIRGRQIFEELPSEVRREFDQSPAKFFEFVNNPENAADLARVLPAIAEPGSYFPAVDSGAAHRGTAGPATGPSEVTSVPPSPPASEAPSAVGKAPTSSDT